MGSTGSKRGPYLDLIKKMAKQMASLKRRVVPMDINLETLFEQSKSLASPSGRALGFQ